MFDSNAVAVSDGRDIDVVTCSSCGDCTAHRKIEWVDGRWFCRACSQSFQQRLLTELRATGGLYEILDHDVRHAISHAVRVVGTAGVVAATGGVVLLIGPRGIWPNAIAVIGFGLSLAIILAELSASVASRAELPRAVWCDGETVTVRSTRGVMVITLDECRWWSGSSKDDIAAAWLRRHKAVCLEIGFGVVTVGHTDEARRGWTAVLAIAGVPYRKTDRGWRRAIVGWSYFIGCTLIGVLAAWRLPGVWLGAAGKVSIMTVGAGVGLMSGIIAGTWSRFHVSDRPQVARLGIAGCCSTMAVLVMMLGGVPIWVVLGAGAAAAFIGWSAVWYATKWRDHCSWWELAQPKASPRHQSASHEYE